MLILLEKERFYIDCEYISTNEKIKIYKDDITDDLFKDGINYFIPSSIINYVINTYDKITVNNVRGEFKFSDDNYFNMRTPKSILCMPLLKNNQLEGVLYLENEKSEGVFTNASFTTLEILSSQMVISLEKIRIYENLEERVREKTKELLFEIEVRKKTEALLENSTKIDYLTGIPNRKGFIENLKRAISVASRKGYCIALLFIDLDGFKTINDTLGHDAGDIVLKTISNRLRENIRQYDTGIEREKKRDDENNAARLGGDEFTVILEIIKEAENITGATKRILEVISKPVNIEGTECKVTGSIGISVYPLDGSDCDVLITKADDAMYRAKKMGKNKYVYYNEDVEKDENLSLLRGQFR